MCYSIVITFKIADEVWSWIEPLCLLTLAFFRYGNRYAKANQKKKKTQTNQKNYSSHIFTLLVTNVQWFLMQHLISTPLVNAVNDSALLQPWIIHRGRTKYQICWVMWCLQWLLKLIYRLIPIALFLTISLWEDDYYDGHKTWNS